MQKEKPTNNVPGSRVLSRNEHRISRKNISSEALKVLYRIHRLGYKGFLVGGAVRDLFLGRVPKDFDVATDARPNRLRKMFRNSRMIGRRFRIVHVFFGKFKTVEVSTFRRSSEFSQKQKNGLILRDNTFGTEKEDANRRDLTINGLFYDISNFSILDYVNGVQDLEDGIVRTIQEPNKSFTEDPVRMIRTLRHASRIDFKIEPHTYSSIAENKKLLKIVNSSRLTEEVSRDLKSGSSEPFFKLMKESGLLFQLFPALSRQLSRNNDHVLWERLHRLDDLVNSGREFSNALMFCLLTYTALISEGSASGGKGLRATSSPNIGKIVHKNIKAVRSHFHIPLQACNRISQIIMGIRRLGTFLPDKKVPASLFGKAYFPDVLDLYEIIESVTGRDAAYFHSLKKKSKALFYEKRKKISSNKQLKEAALAELPQSNKKTTKKRSASYNRKTKRKRRKRESKRKKEGKENH